MVVASAKQTIQRMRELGLEPTASDRRDIHKILSAFARDGLDLRYSMEGSAREYPSLRKLLTSVSAEGLGSFIATEDAYQTVRALFRANRVIPVVGDLAGPKALRGIGADARQRGLVLGVAYTSNVEQYLFEAQVQPAFVANLATWPLDEKSKILRVWFDQGRKHPKQRDGHRTTSLLHDAKPFVQRWAKTPAPTYWHLVQDTGPGSR